MKSGVRGRIRALVQDRPLQALTAAALTALLPDLLVHDVFVCASPRLSAAVRESLRAAGLPARQLHDESLSF